MQRLQARMVALLALAAWLVVGVAAAETVVPSERVRSRVILRAEASAASADTGSLRPGERAELIEAGSGWHRVRLSGGREGFVSAAWTRIEPGPGPEPGESQPGGPRRQPEVERTPVARVATPPPEAPEWAQPAAESAVQFSPEATLEARLVTPEPERRRGLSGIWSRFVSLFRAPEKVSFDLSSPDFGEPLRRHYDPRLPVAGLAHTSRSSGRFDVMLVIDVSGSTSGPAHADVDGDGVAAVGFKSGDSILKAQARAAASFVEAVRRLPGNRQGRRIRVGLVTFSGDDRHHMAPDDDHRFGDEAVWALAHRDARVVAPLTREYDSVLAKLTEVGESIGSGMTDFAAGLALATIELAGLAEHGSESEPRDDAERVIYFMTDGKPRLPHDRERAEQAARRAASLAANERVRIHAFALGHNAVTGRLNSTVARIADRTGGTVTELENPADIVPLLRATRISFVDQVKLVNRSTGEETDYVATGIDGSFYGEIDLEVGANEIEVVAVVFGGKEHVQPLHIEFQPVPREQHMAEALERVREENAGLIDEIKRKLARQMDEARKRNRPEGVALPDVAADGEPGPGQGKELEIELQR